MKKIKLIIDGKEIDAQIDETQLEKKKGRWRAEKGVKYWNIDSYGYIDFAIESKDETDKYRHLIGNYFDTKQEATAYKEYQIALGTILRARDELGGDWKPDWGIFSDKYIIVYNNSSGTWVLDEHQRHDTYSLFGAYKTPEQALRIIDTQKENLDIIRNYLNQ